MPKEIPPIIYNEPLSKEPPYDSNLGKIIISHEFYSCLCHIFGRDNTSQKILMFFATNADGFAVAEKTICCRHAMSKDNYQRAKNKLVDDEYLIQDKKTKRTTVNFEKIYSEGRALQKEAEKKWKGS